MTSAKSRAFLKFLKRRNTIQMFATFLTNMHIPNFFKGVLYNGKIKQVCVPGLNCYSCPAATGACPVGSFQAVVGSSKYNFSYYISGILIFFGVMIGSNITATARIINFVYVKNLNFFVLNFFVGILCNKS